MQKFNATNVSETASSSELSPMIKDWEVLIVSVLDAIITRYYRNKDYPYIDMKLSILTGKDFEPLADTQKDFKSKCSVFGWIQGRGLEALVGHAMWLKNCTVLTEDEKSQRYEKLSKMISDIFMQLEKVRSKNSGHLFFTFTPEGDFFKIDELGNKQKFEMKEDHSIMSDLFYVKGMLAAAKFTKNQSKVEEAKIFFKKILNDISNETFKGDQVSFDPKNKVQGFPGTKGQGSRMIALGGLAVFAGYLGDEPYWFEKGCEYIQYIMNHHVNYKKQLALQEYDFVERITVSGEPFADEKGVLSDPGHALEFIGLASKFLLILKTKKSLSKLEEQTLKLAEDHFIPLLCHCFEYGYGKNGGGIIKAFDLKNRKPINDDMPWWNLPETMRAAAEVMQLFPQNTRLKEVKRILVLCSNSYFSNYVNPNVSLMAYQTIDKNAKPIDIIPATPDADPGYHTGLSIIDFLGCIQSRSNIV